MSSKKENISLPFWMFYNPDSLGHDIYIEEFGYGVCTPGYIFSETRQNYLLQVVFDGIAHVAVGDEPPFTVSRGGAFFLPPCISHWYQADEEFPTTRAWISWSGDLASTLKKQLDASSNPFFLKIRDLDMVIGLFEKLHDARDQSAASLAAIYSCFYGILSNCMSPTTALPKEKTQENLLVNDIVHYIDNNIMNPLTVSDLSRHFGYDTSSLFRKFKKHTGLSPKEYIQHRRVALAKGLICTTDLPLDTIITRCGYDNKAALNMLFLRYENVSLTKYTAEHRSAVIRSQTRPETEDA